MSARLRPGMRVAVTGATGFIGGHLCARLAAEGVAVRALARRRGTATAWPTGVEEAVVPDLADPGALDRALAGCDAVAHLAGRAHVLREEAADPAAEFHRANVDGTRHVLAAAGRSGVGAVVLLSSVAVLGPPDAGALHDGSAPAPSSAYGASKLAAERLLGEACAGGRVRGTVLRPPMVYGPGMKGNPLRLFRLVDRGIPLPIGAVSNRRSMLYVGNLVDAIVALLAAPAADARPYLVTDGPPLSTAEFVRRAAGALGRPARLLPVPPALLRAAGALGDRVARALPVPLTSATLASLVGTLVLDDTRLREDTGWRPPHAMDDALRRTADWYRRAHPR